MATKKALPPVSEFTLPPETITQGGSYIVDPAAGTAERVSYTKTAAELAAEAANQAPAATENSKG